MNRIVALACVLAAAGCSSGPRTVTKATDAEKKALWEPLVALKGDWEGEMQGQKVRMLHVEVSSGGWVICETIFPGTDHEMRNTYHLDGGSVVLTHYCQVGNQPHMRATAAEAKDGKIEFQSIGVSNLGSDDEGFMGSMTLTIKDADHIVQEWFWHKDGKVTDGPKLAMERKKS